MKVSNIVNHSSDLTSFRIGAASRLTGIPVDTLRIWERRYQVVSPKRSQGADRLYGREDIKRLSLLKKLTDRGHAIGSIAHLPDAELETQLTAYDREALTSQRILSPENPLQIAVLGEILPHRISQESADPELVFTGLHRVQAEFEANVSEKKTDVIILEYPAIHTDTAREIRRLLRLANARHAFVIYGFTSHQILESFAGNEYTFIQAPVSLTLLYNEIKRKLRAPYPASERIPIDITEPAPRRLFSNKGLVEASSASSTVKCECPQHLSSIIQQLIQFEVYSADCENRNAEDAALHAHLKTVTGHARGIMEKALKRVLEAEGITVDTEI